ncbi:hypothetical protein T02_14493 [Trichinella nativa]|uniref:Uncharacterized protein n=1 Tax=Trichinella nativa TaxID=6335 RepID=A0A0V1LUN0_9BILA|nr:hypothetical protein T02_14493 [Trichinella nativa]
MEIFKKEKKILRRLSNFQVDRQTDRQRGREAGLNNYNNATDPEHANQFHAFPHSALLAFQTSNRQAVCEMKHCVVVSGVFVNKGGESRDNDYDGKEENERDINIISKLISRKF